jgi:hypothetical protein
MAYNQKMTHLASELFRVFAECENCPKVKGYFISGRGSQANPDWRRFARELSKLSKEGGDDVERISLVKWLPKFPLLGNKY